jgi:hypothetical protein
MHHTPCPIHYTNRLYRGVQYTIHYAPYTILTGSTEGYSTPYTMLHTLY